MEQENRRAGARPSPGAVVGATPGMAAVPAEPATGARARLGPLAALIAIGIGWGGATAALKLTVSTGHHPIGLIFWHFAIFSALLVVIARLRGRRLPLSRPALRFYVLVACLGAMFPAMAELPAAVHLPAGVLAIVISMVPMFSLMLALAVGEERPDLRRILGVGLGAAAIIMLLGPQTSLPDPAAWPYVLLVIVAPLCYAAEGIFVARRMPEEVGPITTLLGASLTGLAATTPMVLLIPGAWVPMPGPMGAAEIAIVANGCLSCLCYWGYVTLVRGYGPVFASMVAYVVTVSGVLWGVALLGESHSGWIWGALGTMVVGMALVQPRR